MNNNQKIFFDLQEKFTSIIYEYYDKQIIELAKLQKKNKDKLVQEIAKILLNETIKDEILDLSMSRKVTLRKKLYSLIDTIFKDEISKEQGFTKSLLEDVSKDKYYSNSYLYGLGVNYTLKPVKENVLKKILNKKIQGKNYSDRIWDNKNKVAKQMRVEVDQFLNGKTTVNEINSRVKKRFNQNWNNTDRLVRNEIGRVQEETNSYWRQAHDIKKVMYSATLDMKTCSDCSQYDGKVYDVSNAPTVPRHVLCRCTLISLVDEDWRPKSRYDNESKEKIDFTTYQEWKKQNLNDE